MKLFSKKFYESPTYTCVSHFFGFSSFTHPTPPTLFCFVFSVPFIYTSTVWLLEIFLNVYLTDRKTNSLPRTLQVLSRSVRHRSLTRVDVRSGVMGRRRPESLSHRNGSGRVFVREVIVSSKADASNLGKYGRTPAKRRRSVRV